jgi:hypothetical protein
MMVWGLEKYRQASRNNRSGGYRAVPGFFPDSVLKSCCLPTSAVKALVIALPSIDLIQQEF